MGCRLVFENFVLQSSFVNWPGYAGPINADVYTPFLDPSPSHIVRIPTTAGAVSFYVDLGYSRSVDTIALVNTSLGVGSYVLVAGTAADPPAGWPGNALFSMSATLGDRERARNQVVMSLSTAAVAARYVVVYIQTTDPFVDIGHLVIGSSWRAGYFNLQYALGRVDLGQREVNQQTGAAFDFVGAKLRVQTFTLGTLDLATVRATIDDIDRRLGATGDILFIPDDFMSYDEMSRQSIYGSCRPQGDAFSSQFFNNLLQRPYRVQERG